MDDETLLGVIYRGRPETVGGFATLAHLEPAEARRTVDRLRERGLLSGAGEQLGYPNPAAWAAATVSAQSGELRRRADDVLSDMERISSELPGMLRHWAVGESSADLVPVATRHGPHASEDLWYDTAQHDVGTLHAVLPDVGRFIGSPDERAQRFARALMGKQAVRVIIPTSSIDLPGVAASMQHFGSAGVQYRLLDEPPSWFWVDGDQLAVPFEWGEGRPTSVLGVRNSSLARMALDYFDRLWAVSGSAAPAAHPWTALLEQMRQGSTLETASRRLGINPRTGRRRVAAAMEHYGVSTLFALGTAWAADPSGGR